MITIAKKKASSALVQWQQGFLQLLPMLEQQARRAFRHLSAEAREDAICEVIANALVAYHRLFERGDLLPAFPTALAKYGVKQYRAGRRVGDRLNCKDVGSEHCRQRKGVVLESLDHRIATPGGWQEIVVEDRHAGPDQIAATRIDFQEWLGSLPPRSRALAQQLALGETTRCVAWLFGLSPGRVAQLRRQLHQAWREFQGEVARTTSSVIS